MIKILLFRLFSVLSLFLFCFIALFFSVPTYAQKIVSDGAVPFTRLYSPKEYQAGIVNMAVKKDKNGLLYFANTEGVLQFDGKNWRTIQVPKSGFIRVLDVDNEGTVFIGAINVIGKLEADSIGKLEFVSLIDLLDSADRNFGEVWKVKATPKGVFFSTDKYIFRYQDGKISKWTTEGKYFYLMYYVNEKVYVLDSEIGLKKLESEELKLVPNHEPTKKYAIYFMLPYPKTQKGEILIGKNKASFSIYNPETNQFRDFQTDLTADEVSSVYHGLLGKDGNYYISTLRYGIICINQEGKKLFQYRQGDGITNKVYGAELDNQNNLWLALAKGIAKIELGSPFKQYGEDKGITGIVTDVATQNGLFYVSTTNGVFYHDSNKNNFLPLQGNSYQTWKLQSLVTTFKPFDTLFFAATNIGISQIKGKSWKEYMKTDASSNYLISSTTTPNRLYAGVLNQQGSYKLDFAENKTPIFSKVISDLTISGLEMKDNLVFVLDGQEKLHIFEEKDSLEELKVNFDAYKVVNIAKHNQEIFVTTFDSVYTWKNKNLEAHLAINKLKGEEETFTQLHAINSSNSCCAAI